jgi:hypothetical protein
MDWASATRWFFNTETIRIAGDVIDFVSVHWYPNTIDPAHPHNGRIHPYPQEVMANYLFVPAIIDDIEKTFRKYAPNRRKGIEVAFLEWDGAGDGPASDFPPYSQGIVQWSLANAIFCADSLGMMAMNGVSAAVCLIFKASASASSGGGTGKQDGEVSDGTGKSSGPRPWHWSCTLNILGILFCRPASKTFPFMCARKIGPLEHTARACRM